MQFYTFDGTTMKTGISINIMSQLFLEASNDNPGATLDDLPWSCAIDWKAGKGVALITFKDQSQETQEFNEDFSCDETTPSTKNAIVLPEGSIVQLMPENKSPFTVKVSKNDVGIKRGLLAQPDLASDEKPSDTKEQLLVRKWLKEGRVGTSSKTMAHVLYGLPEKFNPSDYDGPYDRSDFGRCLDFLKFVPQARKRLNELEHVRGFEKIAQNFEALEELYKKEMGNATGKAPLLYEKIRKLRALPLKTAKP